MELRKRGNVVYNDETAAGNEEPKRRGTIFLDAFSRLGMTHLEPDSVD